jgi:hypothetical protein
MLDALGIERAVLVGYNWVARGWLRRPHGASKSGGRNGKEHRDTF